MSFKHQFMSMESVTKVGSLAWMTELGKSIDPLLEDLVEYYANSKLGLP